jgi:hypothetical protein
VLPYIYGGMDTAKRYRTKTIMWSWSYIIIYLKFMINRASRKYMIVIFYCTKKLEAASKVFIDITDIIFHGLRRT